MGNACGGGVSTLPEPAARIVLTAHDSGMCNLPGRGQLINQLGKLGDRKCVPGKMRQHFSFAEWLDILSQFERTFCTSGGPCRGPDPLLAAGQTLAASLNASYTATRGVSFLFTSRAWHPDRPGQQFDRSFVIDASVGECCIQTQETTIHVKIPEGVKPGKTFSVEALDGQVIPVSCPAGGKVGQDLPVTLKSPVLAPQQLSISVPAGTAGGETIQAAMPGGGMTAVQLPADAVPGQSLTFTVHSVQLMPMRDAEVSIVVPAGSKPGQTICVAVPAGTKMVQIPKGCQPGSQITITAKVPQSS